MNVSQDLNQVKCHYCRIEVTLGSFAKKFLEKQELTNRPFVCAKCAVDSREKEVLDV